MGPAVACSLLIRMVLPWAFAEERCAKPGGEKFAGRNLFKSSSMKNIVDPFYRLTNTIWITHITNIKFYFFILQMMTHIVLFLFITGKNTDFFDIGIKKSFQYSITEGTCSTGD